MFVCGNIMGVTLDSEDRKVHSQLKHWMKAAQLQFQCMGIHIQFSSCFISILEILPVVLTADESLGVSKPHVTPKLFKCLQVEDQSVDKFRCLGLVRVHLA